eukprot:g26204.t1
MMLRICNIRGCTPDHNQHLYGCIREYGSHPEHPQDKGPPQIWPSIVERILIINVHGEALQNIGYSQYLGSVLLAKAAINEEIQHHLQCASAAFSHLRKRVIKDNNIRSDIKIMVYRAV